MSRFTFEHKSHLRSGFLTGLLCATTWSVAVPAYSADQKESPIPDFSSNGIAWIAHGVNFQPGASGPHEVTNDPAYPFRPAGRGEARTWRMADLTNPILQPWAREVLKKRNEHILAGGAGYTRQVSCWPLGVPAFLLYPVQPIYFIQLPKQVLLIAQLDAQIRHVYLDVPHSEVVKPSWYGESVGHYEGDTLVVDTIGMNEQTFIDNYRTPHSDKLHVIERFHKINDGNTLEVNVHIDDPGAFTTPWNTVQRYDRVEQGPMVEYRCAENNLNVGDLEAMPQATTPDF